MKTLLYSTCLFFFFLSLQAQTPLPPFDSHPVWEVRLFTFGGYYDTTYYYTYGRTYERCNQQYIAVTEGENELLYLRMTDERVYYLLDLDDCADERLMYDYAAEVASIPVRIRGEFQPAIYTNTGDYVLPPLGNAIQSRYAEYEVFNAPFFHQNFWVKGVGDDSHPFFPLFNSLHPGDEGVYSLRSLYVDHVLWYCHPNEDCVQAASGNIIYVNQHVSGGQNDGTSWIDAFSELSEGLAVASFGDMIWVAEGVYHPQPDTNRASSFVVTDGVRVYGGFAGNETSFWQRDMANRRAILSGDIGVLGDSTDNSYHVVRIQDAYHYAVLDGLDIVNGNAYGGDTEPELRVEAGGGIVVDAAETRTDTTSLVINHCRIANNSARHGAGVLFNYDYNIPTNWCVSDTRIEQNNALSWGGGVLIGGLNYYMNCQFRQVMIAQNTITRGGAGGGGIADFNERANWSLEDCEFVQNRSDFGDGGAFYATMEEGDKQFLFSRTNFVQNLAFSEGGAIHVVNQDIVPNDTTFLELNIVDCTFIENMAQRASGGTFFIGSISPFFLTMLVENSIFQNNSAEETGGIYLNARSMGDVNIAIKSSRFLDNFSGVPSGGALNFHSDYSAREGERPAEMNVEIDNCLFAGNEGAVEFTNVDDEREYRATLSNCTFYRNGNYPIVKFDFENIPVYEVTFINSIIYEPGIPLNYVFYNGQVDPDRININRYYFDHCLLSSPNCQIPGCEEALGDRNNLLGLDARFRAPEQGNFSLLGCSPAINAGRNLAEMPMYDLAGNLRLREEQVDIGVYEILATTLELDSTQSVLSCYGDTSGYVTLRAVNALGEVQYSLFADDGSQQPIRNTDGYFSGVGAGEYTLRYEDEDGCTGRIDWTVSAPDSIVLYFQVENYQPAGSAGSIEVDSINGGTQPYALYFQEELRTTTIFSGLEPGVYPLRIVDANDCVLDTLVEISLLNQLLEKQALHAALHTFPNPVKIGQHLQVRLNETLPTDTHLRVIDTGGRQLAYFPWQKGDWEKSIPIPATAGTYLLLLSNKAGQILGHTAVVVD